MHMQGDIVTQYDMIGLIYVQLNRKSKYYHGRLSGSAVYKLTIQRCS